MCTDMFKHIVRIRVMCIIVFVNARVRNRYATDSNIAAAVTKRRRYTVCLEMGRWVRYVMKSAYRM